MLPPLGLPYGIRFEDYYANWAGRVPGGFPTASLPALSSAQKASIPSLVCRGGRDLGAPKVNGVTSSQKPRASGWGVRSASPIVLSVGRRGRPWRGRVPRCFAGGRAGGCLG